MLNRFTKLALVAALVAPLAAHAESTITTGAGTPLTASARLDFRITVPKVIYLRVSSGANMATVATPDLIDFVVPAASVGNGTAVAAIAASGDLGNGVVTARVIGNNGTVTFTSTTTGALSNGTDTISYAQISAAAATLTSATALPHPTLADGATTTVTLTPTGKIVNQDAKWTFSYLNTNVVAAGTYGGVNTNNGRVTYTASMP
jgi:hypothetical protein